MGKPREFSFGPDCGQHCGQLRGGKLSHCHECHVIKRALVKANNERRPQ